MLLKHETQTINADAARIASLRMELVEEMNGLGPIHGICKCGWPLYDSEKWGCTLTHCCRPCEQDEDGVTQLCPHCNDFPCRCLMEQEESEDILPPDSLDAFCRSCKTTENLRDGDECFACYDMRLLDAEMFARHGGDV